MIIIQLTHHSQIKNLFQKWINNSLQIIIILLLPIIHRLSISLSFSPSIPSCFMLFYNQACAFFKINAYSLPGWFFRSQQITSLVIKISQLIFWLSSVAGWGFLESLLMRVLSVQLPLGFWSLITWVSRSYYFFGWDADNRDNWYGIYCYSCSYLYILLWILLTGIISGLYYYI